MAEEKKKLCPLTFTLASPMRVAPSAAQMVALHMPAATFCMENCAWYIPQKEMCAVLYQAMVSGPR